MFVGSNAIGNCSLNLNNYGAKNIKDSFGNIVNNLKANIPYNLCYNGSDFILQGKGGGGNATADKLLSGSTATVDSGSITGTMPNQETKTATLNCGGSYIIPAGYHNGSGKVTANSLASQTPGNATAAQILAGFSAWVNGNNINGNATLQSLGGKKFKLGEATTPDGSSPRSVTVTVGFRPSLILVWRKTDTIPELEHVRTDLIEANTYYYYSPWSGKTSVIDNGFILSESYNSSGKGKNYVYMCIA